MLTDEATAVINSNMMIPVGENPFSINIAKLTILSPACIAENVWGGGGKWSSYLKHAAIVTQLLLAEAGRD